MFEYLGNLMYENVVNNIIYFVSFHHELIL